MVTLEVTNVLEPIFHVFKSHTESVNPPNVTAGRINVLQKAELIITEIEIGGTHKPLHLFTIEVSADENGSTSVIVKFNGLCQRMDDQGLDEPGIKKMVQNAVSGHIDPANIRMVRV